MPHPLFLSVASTSGGWLVGVDDGFGNTVNLPAVGRSPERIARGWWESHPEPSSATHQGRVSLNCWKILDGVSFGYRFLVLQGGVKRISNVRATHFSSILDGSPVPG
jgi:hypothetical protein